MRTLLASILLTLLVIAGLLGYRTLNDEDGPPVKRESAEHSAAREAAEDQAKLYCAMGGVVPGITSLYDPKYLACVEVESASNLAEWESANPGE